VTTDEILLVRRKFCLAASLVLQISGAIPTASRDPTRNQKGHARAREGEAVMRTTCNAGGLPLAKRQEGITIPAVEPESNSKKPSPIAGGPPAGRPGRRGLETATESENRHFSTRRCPNGRS
jgi:hypothetical protein